MDTELMGPADVLLEWAGGRLAMPGVSYAANDSTEEYWNPANGMEYGHKVGEMHVADPVVSGPNVPDAALSIPLGTRCRLTAARPGGTWDDIPALLTAVDLSRRRLRFLSEGKFTVRGPA
jgi:hypothetical protein